MEALGAGIAISIAALGGTLGIGLMMSKAFESIARQPEITGRIRPLIFVGIAFIEAAVLYALVIAIMLASKTPQPAAHEQAAVNAARPAATTVVASNAPAKP